jgi:hypothetical protein
MSNSIPELNTEQRILEEIKENQPPTVESKTSFTHLSGRIIGYTFLISAAIIALLLSLGFICMGLNFISTQFNYLMN